jgi:hypothetical protein
MTKVTLIFSLIFMISLNLQAQDNGREFLIKEYLKQSEKQKKTGITFLLVGSGMMAAGIIATGISSNSSDSGDGIGPYLILVGIPITIIGVPIVISSASKARKAAHLSLGTQTVRGLTLPQTQKVYPALTFTVNLNSSN